MAKVKRVFRPDLLKDLANYLNKIDNQFNLDGWVQLKEDESWWIDKEKAAKLTGKKPPTHKLFKECGTTGCAMGHAPSVPSIWKAGLRLTTTCDNDNGDNTTTIVPENKFTGSQDFEAAMEIFGIPRAVSEYFFDPDQYDTHVKNPKIVAKRIYEFLENPMDHLHYLGEFD